MNSFMLDKKEVLRSFNVDENKGLSENQIEENLKKYGKNSFTKQKSLSFFAKIIAALSEPMIIMLILAWVITIAINTAHFVQTGEIDFVESVGIFVAIFLSVIITLFMEGKSAKAFEALSKINENILVKVIRNSNILMIPQEEVVVGDIVYVETGNKICADGRLIESVSLHVDESALTGESIAVEKNADAQFESEEIPIAGRINMLYSGCFVTSGSGKIVVSSVGDGTEFGLIARELSNAEKTTTPLQEKLLVLSKKIAIIGFSVAAVIFILQVLFAFLENNVSLASISDAFITSVVLIVACVPEGLPTIVAVSLSINVIKMSKQNALVKKIIACETIGSVNVICSDKTGTLTENKMTVADVYANGKIIAPNEVKDINLINNFAVNSTADIDFENGSQKFLGNPTECAILASLYKSAVNYKEIRAKNKIVHSYPFSSETKNMSTVTQHAIYTKGSPEKILSMCQIEVGEKQKIEAKITEFQEKACRVIAFAHKDLKDKYVFESDRHKVEHEMTFDGFVAITDPLRPDVGEAVAKCKSAGINVKMLTGDNIITARAIATELGILDYGCMAVEAGEIEALSDEELSKKLPFISVIARSTPVVKMRVVNLLKSLGNVVAVTGDGINDAPAIKNADVGIAMGIAGTEVSKEASDVVLLDDSFSTIEKAIEWGRGIYENFQRFIQFQLTVNMSSVIVVLFSIIAGLKAPFTAIQLLWINIVMDGPPAISLGLEPIHDNLMKRKPVARDSSIISKEMMLKIVLNGLFISIVFMAQNIWNFMGANSEQNATVLFTMFVLFQIFNSFNSRKIGNSESIFVGIFNNKLMLLALFVTFCLQIVITQFGGRVFKTTHLGFDMWVRIVCVSLSVVVFSEIITIIRKIFIKKI